MLLGTPATSAEKRLFRRLPMLLRPGGPPPGWNDPTPVEQAERARLDAEHQRLQAELAEIKRRYPAMVAAEEARETREAEEIRRRVIGRVES